MWDVLCRNVGLFQEFKRLESDDKTGIIALKSPLDTAVRILDYRLSQAKDTTTCIIYTYCISLLKEKIAKIHKKLTTSVPSPIPVSPNKYASLVVEDIDTQYATDCADAPTPFVSLGSATIPSTVSHTKHVWYSEHGTYH